MKSLFSCITRSRILLIYTEFRPGATSISSFVYHTPTLRLQKTSLTLTSCFRCRGGTRICSFHSHILFPLPRGHCKATTDVLRTSCFTINRDRFESELSPIPIYSKSRSFDRLVALVEIPGFEPGQTEPKSVVLPLHHISIPRCKDIIFLCICKRIRITRR